MLIESRDADHADNRLRNRAQVFVASDRPPEGPVAVGLANWSRPPPSRRSGLASCGRCASGVLAVPARVAARLPHLSKHDIAEIDAGSVKR